MLYYYTINNQVVEIKELSSDEEALRYAECIKIPEPKGFLEKFVSLFAERPTVKTKIYANGKFHTIMNVNGKIERNKETEEFNPHLLIKHIRD